MSEKNIIIYTKWGFKNEWQYNLYINLTGSSLETLISKCFKNICQAVIFLAKSHAYSLQLCSKNESFASIWQDS